MPESDFEEGPSEPKIDMTTGLAITTGTMIVMPGTSTISVMMGNRRNHGRDNYKRDNQRDNINNNNSNQEQLSSENRDRQHGSERERRNNQYDDGDEDDRGCNYHHYRRLSPTSPFTGYDDDEYSGIVAFTRDLRICIFPRNFKPVGIDKYDGKTAPVEWLRMYSTVIRSADGDTL